MPDAPDDVADTNVLLIDIAIGLRGVSLNKALKLIGARSSHGNYCTKICPRERSGE